MKEKNNKKERKYFEVFGDAMNWVMFLRTLVIIMAIVIVFLVTMLAKSVNKPPLVVKVDKIGRAEAIKEWASDTKITLPEIANFTQSFLDRWMKWDFYTYQEDFGAAAKMMTAEQQQRAQEYINANKVQEQIDGVRSRGKVYVTKIELKKDSRESATVSAKGYREIYSYLNPDFKKEVVFEVEIVAKKVSRSTQSPWGLLVDYYKEEVFREK